MASSQNFVVWYNRTDTALYAWTQNFGSSVSQYETELGLDTADLEQIQESGQAFIAAMDALVEARAAYLAAVQAKDTARQTMIDIDRQYVLQFQAMPNLDPKVLLTLDVPQRRSAGPRSAPNAPTNPVATATANGTVRLRFGRNGNSPTTVFTIEQSTDQGATWTPIFSSTRTRITLQGYTPGVTTWFRVTATRNGMTSPPTEYAPIWSSSSTPPETLTLAA